MMLRDVKLELRSVGYLEGNPPVFTDTETTDINGNVTFVLTGVMPDTYHLLLTPDNNLRWQLSNFSIVSGSQSWNVGYGGGCDLNGNNKVEIFDYDILVQNYNDYAPWADCVTTSVGNHGIVDLDDFTLMVSTWGRVGNGGPTESVTPGSPPGQLALSQAIGEGKETISSEDNIFQVGEVFTLTIDYDTADLLMAGTDVVVDYDHCVLDLLENQITHSGIFSTTRYITNTGMLDYQAGKWLGVFEGQSVSGTGYLAKIPFQVIAGLSNSTTVAIRFNPGGTTESNMDEDQAVQEFLGTVNNYQLYPTGFPQRPSQTAQLVSPLHGDVISENGILLQAQTTDPCNAIQKVTFLMFPEETFEWEEIGTDTNGTDGWNMYWDASEVSDQSFFLKVFASDMAGNGVESPIILMKFDRQPPVINNFVINPLNVLPGEPVGISFNVTDNLTGISSVEVYVDPSTDGSTPWGSWDLIGSFTSSTVNFTWDTSGYSIGLHRIVLVLEDEAGNQIFWPTDSVMRYPIGIQTFLPVITR